VSKLHVLALRGIVTDLGADKGVLLSEAGFQSGAQEAANLTNVELTSIRDLRENASGNVYAMRLRDLFDRVGVCKDRYWGISKDDRIKFGLRADVNEHPYSGARVADMCLDLLTRAFRGTYPFKSDAIDAYLLFGRDKEFGSPMEVALLVEKKVSELERKLDAYDRQYAKSVGRR
jgi:hypothetical protein